MPAPVYRETFAPSPLSVAKGRPCGLTKECEAALLKAISQGLPLKHAANLAGISYDTLNRWKKRGEADEAPEVFRHFCKALEHAEAKAVQVHLSNIAAAGTRDWRASAWILERRHSDEFGRPDEKAKAIPASPQIGHEVLARIRKQEGVVDIALALAKALQRRRLERDEQMQGGFKKNLRE